TDCVEMRRETAKPFPFSFLNSTPTSSPKFGVEWSVHKTPRGSKEEVGLGDASTSVRDRGTAV
ncbi:MAG TPA: hypothetical protein VJK02_24540, partial [Anaerolineales bacterium]|nr:hypothetical protein [Anaerolineales bacterium]